jgi:hypothetical protein
VVSTLNDTTWSSKTYERLADDKYVEKMFALDGRMYILTASVQDAITFHDLFLWNEDAGNWTEIPIEIDPDASQELTRGPSYVISQMVPDSSGNIVYLLATDHETNKNDSATTFVKLEVHPDRNKATLSTIAKTRGDHATAATSMAFKDDQLFVIVSNFTDDPNVAEISIAYTIDVNSGQRTPIAIQSSPASTLKVEYNQDRTFVFDDYLLVIGPPSDAQDNGTVSRHLWFGKLDTESMTWQETDGRFPENIFVVDDKNNVIFTGGVKNGAYVARLGKSVTRGACATLRVKTGRCR